MYFNPKFARKFHVALCVLALYGGALALWLGPSKATTKHATAQCKFKTTSRYEPASVDFGSGMSSMAGIPKPREGLMAILPDDVCDKDAPHVPAARPYQESTDRYANPAYAVPGR